MKAIRYCDAGACRQVAAFLASHTKLNGEKCTSASCTECLPRMKQSVILGIQEAQPLNWVEFDQSAKPATAVEIQLKTPMKPYRPIEMSVLDW